MLQILKDYTSKRAGSSSENDPTEAEMSSSTCAVGIDLGTTFSCVAVYSYKHGTSQVIPNSQYGDRLTPSFVFYDPNTDEVSVGKYADEWGLQAKTNFIYDVKRLMGRKFDDIYVQQLINNGNYNYKIVRGRDDNAEIEVKHNNMIVNKSPEEVSSEILRYLKDSASKFLGFEVKEAVVSVPAHFSNAQRKATKKAAELAGLKVLKLVCEPVAAAIHYSIDKLKTKTKLLVFDFGGGTLDVSVIDVDNDKFEVKGIEGDSFLGGRDFDQKLLDYCFAEAKSKISNENDKRNSEHILRLKKKCTKLKILLSMREEATITLDHFGRNENKELSLTVSRKKFEEINTDLFSRAQDLVTQCLSDLEIAKNSINEVLLVGGSTRIPKVVAMLKEYFKDKTLKTDLNPDEAVALGAAVQAAIFKKDCLELEKYKITDVTPFSLGFELSGGLMRIAIKKNSPLPAKSKVIKTVTCENNQKECTSYIFEGERKNCKFNVLLAKIKVNDLPPKRAGDVNFKTTFNLDEDGILEVELAEDSNNNKKKIFITTREHHLNNNKVKSTLEEAQKHKEEDDIFEEYVRYRRRVRQYCNRILYDLNKILDTDQRVQVENNCMEVMSNSKKIDYKNIEGLRKTFEDMRQKVDPIIKNKIIVKF